jgi:membrane protein required for colicin V production
MIETHLSIFDAIVCGVMIISCLFAFFRGFVREILSLGAWVGAAVITLYYFKTTAETLQEHFKDPVVAAGFATLGLYMGSLIVFSIVNAIILKFLKSGEEIGAMDNIFGLIFGALRGAFIVAAGYFLLMIVLPENETPDWLKASVTRPYAEQGALMLVKVAPDYVRELSSFEKRIEKEDSGAFGAEESGAERQRRLENDIGRATSNE